MAQQSNTQRILAELRKFPSIDPQAELAVAGQEGLGGGIGDGGHAFGPNQENDAGGVLTGRFPGETQQQLQSWAWSVPGIDDALSRIARVAGGLKGAPAVRAIVSQFERPANPGGEIARALAAYGLPAPAGQASAPYIGSAPRPSGPSPAAGSSGAAPQQNGLAQMLAAAIGNANQTVGLPNPAGLGSLLAKAAAGKTMGAGR